MNIGWRYDLNPEVDLEGYAGNTQYLRDNDMVVHTVYTPDDGEEYKQFIGNLESLNGDCQKQPRRGRENWEDAPDKKMIDAGMEQFDWEFFDAVEDDEPVIINANGGKQHKLTRVRPDLVPSDIHYEVAKVLAEGAEHYGEENWKLIPTKDHIAHAQRHLMMFQVNPNLEDLTHLLCRAYFAAHLFNQESH